MQVRHQQHGDVVEVRREADGLAGIRIAQAQAGKLGVLCREVRRQLQEDDREQQPAADAHTRPPRPQRIPAGGDDADDDRPGGQPAENVQRHHVHVVDPVGQHIHSEQS